MIDKEYLVENGLSVSNKPQSGIVLITDIPDRPFFPYSNYPELLFRYLIINTIYSEMTCPYIRRTGHYLFLLFIYFGQKLNKPIFTYYFLE